MPRFFPRLAEGVFDLDDLRTRTGQLADFVEAGPARVRNRVPLAVGSGTGPTSGRRCSCFGPACWVAGSFSARWYP